MVSVTMAINDVQPVRHKNTKPASVAPGIHCKYAMRQRVVVLHVKPTLDVPGLAHLAKTIAAVFVSTSRQTPITAVLVELSAMR